MFLVHLLFVIHLNVHKLTLILPFYSVSGTEARIVFVDETGNEKQVMPLAGHFVDKEDSLVFGQGEDRVDIIMSSDACNTAVATPPYAPQDQGDSNQNEDEEGEFEEEEEDTGKDYELDIGLALEAPANASAPGDEQDSGIFKRGLRNGLHDPSLSVVKPSTGASSSGALSLVVASPSEVLARHRAAFAKAKIASREGRKLQGDSTNFEMCTPGSPCVIDEPVSQCRLYLCYFSVHKTIVVPTHQCVTFHNILLHPPSLFFPST